MKKGDSEEGLRHLYRSKGQVPVLICNLYIGTLCKLLFAECISVAYLTKVRESHWTRQSLWTLLLLSCFSCVRLFVILWTVACQAPLSMRFSKEYWSELPCPPPGDLPDPGIEPEFLTSPASAGGFFTISTTREALLHPLPIPIGPIYSSNKQLVSVPTVLGSVHCFYDSSSRLRREGKESQEVFSHFLIKMSVDEVD